jgi:hypothetical protein
MTITDPVAFEHFRTVLDIVLGVCAFMVGYYGTGLLLEWAAKWL